MLPGFSVDKVVRHGPDGWGIWHFPFHASPFAELLVQGREEIYISWFFRNNGYSPDEIAANVRAYQQPGALHASFAYYRAFYESGQQNLAAAAEKLTVPVLAIGGSMSVAAMVEIEMKQVATNVIGMVAPECGHWVPEEQPEWLTAQLLEFLRA